MDLLAPDPSRPIGLMLSGGGARGAFQVGVWKALCEHPRGLRHAPTILSGTSAGALNAALIAGGLSPERMLEFWLDLAERPPVRVNEAFFRTLTETVARLVAREPLRGKAPRLRELRVLGKLVREHRWYRGSGLLAMGLELAMTARFDTLSALLDGIAAPYLFDTTPLKERLAHAIGGYTIKSSMRLAINAVDVRTGGVVRIVNHPPVKRSLAASRHYRYEPEISLDMILASASIPLLFNPVELGGQLLWDGGLIVNSPMAPAVALGARRLIPVLVTTGPVHPGAAPRTFGGAIERLADAFLENAYTIDRKLLLDRNALAERSGDPELRVVELFRAIRPQSSELFDAGSYLYFEPTVIRAMHAAGEVAGRAWLDRGIETDTRDRDD